MNEPFERSVTIETISQLEKLALPSENHCLSSIEIGGLAALRLSLIELLISKNRTTLQTLIINGSSMQKVLFTEESCMHLAAAIKDCNKLKKLSIINYKTSLRNGIQYFTDCLTKLPNLIELSFNTTYLSSHAETLLPNLAIAKSIIRIDLTHTALLTMAAWSAFCVGLSTNTSLQEVILGTSPLQPGELGLLINGLMSPENSVTVLNWTPLPFDENEKLHRELCAAVNWFGQPTIKNTELSTSGKQFTLHKETGYQSPDKYQQSCLKLEELKKFIAQRHNQTPVTDLFIEIENETDFSLDYIAVQIFAQRATVKKLIIRFKSIERENPLILDRSLDFFVRALQACNHLETLNIDNFQGIFTGNQLMTMLQGLASLPKLHSLSFNKTYLGERGTDALTLLLKRNRITELNLTLAGLISDNCFLSLAKAISLNPCLRKIILGNSPMTVFWAKLLVQAVEKNRSQHSPEITWHNSPKSEMAAKMHAMCVDLCAATPVNDIIYIYNKFLTDCCLNPNFDCKHLDDFITYNSSSDNLTQNSSSRSVNTRAKDIELDEVTSIPLVSGQSSAAKVTYGATSSSRPK